MTLESTLAGTWYPGSEREIRARADAWEQAVASDAAPSVARPNVILLPHAGWAYSGETAWRAVRLVRGADFRRVVVLAPSHRAWIENRLVTPEADAVSTPLGKIAVDRDWIDRLALVAPVTCKDKIHLAEHSAQIEFPLLQLALKPGFTVVPLVMGAFGADQMGMCARALSRLMDAQTLLVISSDFTHYGTDFSYAPYGTSAGETIRGKVAAVDGEAFALMAGGDADACLAYATSSDKERDFSRFVCYTAAAGRAAWAGETGTVLDAAARAYLLRAARESLERAVRNGPDYGKRHVTPADAPPATRAKMGAFVTLNDKETGMLRGCIGEILPMRPLLDAVIERAVDSALRDPRFSPVSERELATLRVEVSALTPPRRVASWRDIVLGRDGMTLEKNGAFAVFLPQVAPEQGWDLPTTLTYLSQKAGLPPDAWREGATFETFQAEVFHE